MLNDQAVATPQAFQQLVGPLLASATITITVERSGSAIQLTLMPGWRPATTTIARSTATPVGANLYYQ